jgi:hypothetical protein
MKNRIFNVPADSIVEFAEIIGDNEMEGVIIGVNDDDDIEISVGYEPEDSEAILDMIEYVENLQEDPDEDD